MAASQPASASQPAPASPPASVWALLRDGGRPLLALLVLALGLKLLVLLAAASDDPLARLPTSDSRYYLARAMGLSGRVDDPLAEQPYHLPPLYPYVLAAIPGTLDGRFLGVQALQALAGTLALAAVFVLARRRVGRWAALAAALLTFAYGPLTFFEVKLLGDSLACSLLLLGLVLEDAVVLRRGWPRAAGLGASLALVALLRPQMLLLLPLASLDLLRRRMPREATALVLAAGLVLTPSTLHNLRAGAGWTPVSDNGGVNLWLANSGPPSGTFRTIDEAFGDIDRQATSARRVAEGLAGRALDPAEVGATLRAAAWDAAWADPGVYAKRLALRAQALLENFETGIICVPEVEATLIAPLRLLLLPFGLALALGGAGLLLCAAPRRGRAVSVERGGAPLVLLVGVAGVVLLTTLLFFHYSRFRLPLLPLLALAAVAGGERLATRSVSLDWSLAAGVLGAALAWVSWLPGSHHADTLAIGWTSLSEARLALADPGRRAVALELAAEDVQRALDAAPGLVRALFQQASVSLSLEHFDACAAALDLAEARLPGHPQALMTRAWLLCHHHPGNRHYDLPAAWSLLERLELAAITDPNLQPHVTTLRAFLQTAEARQATGGH